MTKHTYRPSRHRGRCRPASSTPWSRQPEWSPMAPDEPTSEVFDQLATSVGDAVGRIIRSLDPARAAESLAAMGVPTAPAMPGRDRRAGGKRHHLHRGCGCECHDRYDDDCCDCCDCCEPRCGPDPCHCSCCIGDVDLVVYTRVGETRIVPITLENKRARERPVFVQLGEFTTKGGRPSPVVGHILTPTEVVLPPCSDTEVIIAVRVGSPGSATPTPKPQPTPGSADLADLTKAELVDIAREQGITGTSSMTKEQLIAALKERERDVPDREPDDRERTLIDVDDCHVAVADLCVQGCDHRPIRVAVAVLPRDCGPYEVACDCSCCC